LASFALTEATDTTHKHLDTHETVFGTYPDLQKAFETADHEILLYKLSIVVFMTISSATAQVPHNSKFMLCFTSYKS